MELINPVFTTIMKEFFREATIIPYKENEGKPNKILINKTMSFLEKVKELKVFFIKNKSCLERAYKENGYYENFNRYSTKITLSKRNGLKMNNEYGRSYLTNVYLSKNPKDYMLFSFHYPNSSKNGLYVQYKLFFDNRKKIEWKNKNYQSVIELEKNWYLLMYTTVDADSEQWQNVKSIYKKHIWDGVPPLEYIIKPYRQKEIEKLLNFT
jgi:hypothetical protein